MNRPRNGDRIRRCMAAAIMGAMTGVSSSAAAVVPGDPFATIQTVDNADLASRRGGFNVGGVDVSFGAIAQTIVNGVIVLQTQFVAASNIIGVVQSGLAAASPTPVPSSPSVTVTLIPESSDASASIPPVGHAAASAGPQGVVVRDPTGTSTALTQIGSSGIANSVTSSASGISITQQVVVNVALNNYSSLLPQFQTAQTAIQAQRAVQSALTAGFGH